MGGITAGFLAQATLKHLLHFGTVSNFLGYDALGDFFPTYAMAPNPDCGNNHCRKRQQEWRDKPKVEEPKPVEAEVATELHPDNEWGIEVEDSSSATQVLDKPKEETVDTKGASVSDLMASLKQLNIG